MYGHVWIRDRHHQQELRVLRIRRVEFLAVQYPALAVANGPRPELTWIRATLRLGHGEAREGFACEQRLQIPFLLRRRTVSREHDGVAGVRTLYAKDGLRPPLRADDLIHERELDLTVPLPAEFGTEVACP